MRPTGAAGTSPSDGMFSVPGHPQPPGPLIPQRLLCRAELARFLGFGVSTLDRYKAAGLLPQPIRLGGTCVRWCRAEIEAWLDARKPGGGLLNAREWSAIRADVLSRRQSR